MGLTRPFFVLVCYEASPGHWRFDGANTAFILCQNLAKHVLVTRGTDGVNANFLLYRISYKASAEHREVRFWDGHSCLVGGP